MTNRIWIICMIALLSAVFLMPSMAGAEATVIWDGEVILETGTFDYTPAANQSATYEWNNITDLGALVLASEVAGFDFETNDQQYSYFYLTNLSGIEEEPYVAGVSKSWSVFINEMSGNGLGSNELHNGDEFSFIYGISEFGPAPDYELTVSNQTYILNITVNAPAEVLWDGEVTLETGTFDYTPAANQSATYEWNNITDLGALVVASEVVGFDFKTNDQQYSSFYLTNLSGIEEEPYVAGVSKSWSVFINEISGNGLGSNELHNGDEVSFIYGISEFGPAPDYELTVSDQTYILNILVNANEIVTTPSRGSGGGTGHATILKVVEEEEEPVNPEEPQAVEDSSTPVEETTPEPQPEEPAIELNVETEEAQNGTPGFEGIFAAFGLLLSAVFIMRRRL